MCFGTGLIIQTKQSHFSCMFILYGTIITKLALIKPRVSIQCLPDGGIAYENQTSLPFKTCSLVIKFLSRFYVRHQYFRKKLFYNKISLATRIVYKNNSVKAEPLSCIWACPIGAESVVANIGHLLVAFYQSCYLATKKKTHNMLTCFVAVLPFLG